MDRGPPPASRLPAPSAVPAKRGSGGAGSAPFGLQRRAPSTAPRRQTASPRKETPPTASSSSPPPRLALHELQHGAVAAKPTATFLRRGSGRTIATLASHAVVTPPPSARRPSHEQSPRNKAPTTHGRVASPNATPLRSRHGSRDAAGTAELLAANKIEPTTTKAVGPTPLSPEAYLRQRKRSADMMDPHDPAFLALQAPPSDGHGNVDEVDEPSTAIANADDHAWATAGPMTPPPPTRKSSNGGAPHDAVATSATLPMSSRDPKRQKRLTRSPKTPLGLSTYECEEGGLSATQRVRLSLSGYVSVAGLTARNVRRESTNGTGTARDSGMLLSNGDAPDASAASPKAHATARLAPRSSPSKFHESTSSFARSKFSASRSMSGPQMASALLPSKNAVDCLLGYIRELQRSEAMLRVQLEKERKQRREELSRSTMLVSTLESERELERRELEEQQRMVQALKAEVSELYHAMSTLPPTDSNNTNGMVHQQLQEGADRAVDYNGYSDEVVEGLPHTSYVTPPPSSAGGRQFSRVTQQYPSHVEGVGCDTSTMPQPSEWTEEQTAYYQSQDYYQRQDVSTMPQVDGYAPAGEWPDRSVAFNSGQEYYSYQQDSSTMHTQNTAPACESDVNQEYYDNDQCTAGGMYAPAGPPAVPMSPVAKLNASWSPQDSKSVQPQIEVPPPMFRIAPRLSDIISPLSRSVIAAPVTSDANVLKPVTPQALSNAKHPRVTETSTLNTADQAFMMTPPPLGPPAFSMSGFQSGSERESTPPPSSKTRHQTDIGPNARTNPIAGQVPRQDEQFVPAEQVFKPFHKPKTPKQKVLTTPSKGAVPLPKDVLKALLIEFFTVVDKTKLRMVEGYSRRYQGEETKLLNDLTKKYGTQKVADLKRKFESASKPSEEVEDHPPSQLANHSPPVVPPTLSVPVPTATNPVSTGVASHDYFDPAPAPPQLHADMDSALHATLEQSHRALPTTFNGAVKSNGAPRDQIPPTPVANDVMEIAAPLPGSPPSQKVSPNGARRGPPLPFAFEDLSNVTTEETALEMLPPPQVLVAAPPTTMPAPPHSPPRKAVPPPTGLAPSPPRAPPPTERSPARNASVLRQRVAPQSQMLPLPSTTASSAAPAPMLPPPPLSMNSTPSPPKPNGTHVTLEGLLLEFYRKHQPDHVKNVPELVKLYTGKEREMVSLLKKKYGALSIKRLEQNLEILEQQSSAAAGVKMLGGRSNDTATGLKKAKSRGCFGRVVFFLLKLIVVRVVVTVVLLGGLVALNHSHCPQNQYFGEGVSVGDECQGLVQDIDSFRMSHLMEYVQRVESRYCFCGEWTRRETKMEAEPSVGHAIDLVKLVPFSRTVAEPAWLEFVDKYLPDFPYSEYYQTYAKPSFLVGKEYVFVGAGHAKRALTDVVASMPEMPWQETYEVHGKPIIKLVGEYSESVLKRIHTTCTSVYVAVVDQWRLLVDMYNEEGASEPLSANPVLTDGSAVVKTSIDALTKAAKASKALAEPHEGNEDGPNSVPATEYDVEPSHGGDSDRSFATNNDGEQTDGTFVAPAEVVIEQTGLDLSYSGNVKTDGGIDNLGQGEMRISGTNEPGNGLDVETMQEVLPVDETIIVDETAESVSEAHAHTEMHEVAFVVDAVDDSLPANPILTIDSEPVLIIDDEHSSNVGDVTQHEADIESYSEMAVPTERSVEVDVVIEQEFIDERKVVEDLTTVPAPTIDLNAHDEPASVVVEPEATSVSLQELEPLDPDVDVDAIQLGQIPLDIAEEFGNVSPVGAIEVSTSMDTRHEIIDTETVIPSETTGATDASATEDAAVDFDEQHGEQRKSTVDPTTPENGATTGTEIDEVTPVNTDHADEDLGFLDDVGGLDPLELLDLADMAAAELHSIN